MSYLQVTIPRAKLEVREDALVLHDVQGIEDVNAHAVCQHEAILHQYLITVTGGNFSDG